MKIFNTSKWKGIKFDVGRERYESAAINEQKKRSVDTKIYCENEMKQKKIKTVWNWMKVTSFIFSYSCKYSHLRAFNFFSVSLPILLAFILLYLFKKEKSFGKEL